MRTAVAAAIACLTLVGITTGKEAAAAVRRTTHIEAQGLGSALQTLARERDIQVVYRSEIVGDRRTAGAAGDLTLEEALKQLLQGTDLAYLFLGESAITIVPVASMPGSPPTTREMSGVDGAGVQQKATVWDRLLMVQAGAPPVSEKSAENAPSAEVLPEIETKGIPEILVKGSRIMNVDVKRTEDDVQPYYIFDSKTIERSAAMNIDDFLKQRLTMNTAFISNNQVANNTNGNLSSINLRGLGSKATLILINGRRSASAAIFGAVNSAGQPDLNGIPMSSIERIEVLPSSASAIYGGAAVGGVVNIVLKKQFRGGELHLKYENADGAHAPQRTLDFMYGFSLGQDKTQVMLSGHYADGRTLVLQDRLNLVQRGIDRIVANDPSYLYSAFQPFPGGATNIANRDFSTFPVPVPLTLDNGTSLSSGITSIPTGAAPGSDLTAGLQQNAGTYNLQPAPGTGPFGLQSPIGSAPTTKAFAATIRHQLIDAIEVFTELSTRSNDSTTKYNTFGSATAVPATAPTNPFNSNVIVTFPNDQSVPFSTSSVTKSMTVGLLARLPAGWHSELDYTWSRNTYTYDYFGKDNSALNAAIANGTLDPFVDTIAFPLNLSPYLAPQSFDSGPAGVTLNDLSLRASGAIGTVFSTDPTLTIGVERRREGGHNSENFTVFPLNPAANRHTVNFGQQQAVDSLYAEMFIPLVSTQRVKRLVHSMEVQLAGRSERYSVDIGTPYVNLAPDGSVLPGSPPQGASTTIKYTSTNPTIGLKIEPIAAVAFRASYATAFLPPTASQLLPNPTPFGASRGFGPYYPIVDPQNGQAYNVDTIGGGNPDLKPQTSQSWNFGVIWEPESGALNGLRLGVEHYQITQPDYITVPDVQLIVDSPQLASRVTRDPMTGLITLVEQTPVNATVYKTSGWDIGFDYHRPTSLGSFELHAAATTIVHDERQYAIDSPLLEYVGSPGEGGQLRTKGNIGLNWQYKDWMLGWNTTYYSKYRQIGAPGGPGAQQYGPTTNYTDPQGGFSIPSQTYHDFFGSYSGGRRANAFLSDLEIKFGVKNVFNTAPPFDVYNAYYYYSYYGDSRMRSYWIDVRKGF